MEREILFRGKRTNNREWIVGSFFDYCGIPNILSKGSCTVHHVIPETVGQFTGKTHKSGVKIFEGDIVEYTNKDGTKARYVIEWNEVLSAWVAKWTDGEGHMNLTALVCEYMEIIGNIHDNPELLNGTES